MRRTKKAVPAPPSNDRPIQEARDFIKNHADTGVDCPVCTSLVKIYERRLYSTMVVWLIGLKHTAPSEDGWTHTNDIGETLFTQWGIKGIPHHYGDFAKLKYWGLIEPRTDPSGAARDGFYKITSKGIAFLNGNLKVPAKVRLLQGDFYGLCGPEITAKEALSNDFDYNEIMSPATPLWATGIITKGRRKKPSA